MASTTAVTSLDAATTGTGAAVDFATAKRNVSAVVVASGVASGGAVVIEASHDGVNWAQRLVVHLHLRTGNHAHDFSTGAYRYWRARTLRNVTGGGNITVTFMEAD